MAHCRVILASTAALLLWACSPAPLTDAEIVALDATALRAELAAGRVSALRATQAYLRRIAELDDSGPSLGAVIEVNADAETIARGLDERFAAGDVVGPLHGVPVLVKANIDTADSMATSAGSLALAGHRARADADVVARLRTAGAVLLGKTNLSEWANFRSNSSTSGWSSLGGQTRNAYVLDRNPCGSSSGSAVAVAARLAPLAVGTETDGSIVCPAAANGIVGLKPTLGTVSQRGIVPIAHSQDTAGPMARTAADTTLLLSVLREQPAASERHAVAGLRVGVVRDFAGAGRDPDVEAMLAQVIAWLDGVDVVVVDPINAALSSAADDAELEVLLGEFRMDLDAYLAGVEEGPRSLADVIAYNAEHAAEVMPFFGQELFIAARDNEGPGSASYAAAQAAVAAARDRLAALFAELQLDALIAPTNARAWLTQHEAGDEFRVGSSSLAAVTGYPNVTVPAALARELPLGISLIGKPGDESLLLLLATAIERQRGPFPEPRFLRSVAD